MWKSKRHLLTAAATSLLCVVAVLAYGGESRQFTKLEPGKCFVLGQEAVAQLPPSWQKYKGFIKSCPLREKAEQAAKVAIVAIWVEDYYATQPPDASWEEFPKPLIVDPAYRPIGILPELYPIDEPREADLYYGKWKDGIPQELRVDVFNPAVTGDYHYPPIRFNKGSGKYKMKGQEVIYGRRK